MELIKRPYRSIEFNDERKWKSNHPYDDILQVGIQKAIGYCFAPANDPDVIEMINKFINDKKIVRFKKDQMWNHHIALYVGDLAMIQTIADANRAMLIEKNFPIEAYDIFMKISNDEHLDHYVDSNQPIYHFICDLFNSWCLFCDKPDFSGKVVKDADGKSCLPSLNPYDPDEDAPIDEQRGQRVSDSINSVMTEFASTLKKLADGPIDE